MVRTLACTAMKRPSFDSILAARLSRRALLSSAAAGAGLAACARIPTAQAAGSSRVKPSAFKSIAPQNNDAFVIADGYRYNVVARWGDSLVTGTPDFDTRRMTSTEWLTADAVDAQNRQFGTNCDAVQYFPRLQGRAAQGLVCVNHEYFSAELVFPGHRGVGMKPAERQAWMEQHPLATKFMVDRKSVV